MARTSQLTAIAIVALAVVVLVIAIIVAAGGDDTSAPAGGVESSSSSGTDAKAVALFSDTCGQCHTLTVAGTDGDVGPNLDDDAFTEQRVLSAIENGAGGGTMAPGLLEGADAEAVAKLIGNDDPTLAPNTAADDSQGSNK